MKNWPIYILLGGVFLLATPQAQAQGIRFGGQDTQGSLGAPSGEAGPPARQENQLESQLPGRDPAHEVGRDVLQEAEKLRARYRQQQEEAAGTAHEHRYGFVAAFFDSESLMDPGLVEDLKQLEQMEGLKFALFHSSLSLDKPISQRSQREMKKLENLDPPMARDDTGGHIAKQYNVTRFPTILYETPDHDVIPFYVPNTLEKVFSRINIEKRKQSRR